MEKGPKTVLFVDDQTDLVDLTAMLFADEGYKFISTHRGDEAARLLEEGTFDDVDVGFLDGELPGLHGIELAKKFKQREQSKDTPLVHTTAWPWSKVTNSDETAKLFKVIIPKPFDLEELLLITRILAFREPLDELRRYPRLWVP